MSVPLKVRMKPFAVAISPRSRATAAAMRARASARVVSWLTASHRVCKAKAV